MLPQSSKSRKSLPVASGLLDYFPDALVAVAHCSWVGNEQHNPGQSLHWDREKSGDHPDCLIRHFLERGLVDSDGVRHSAKVAWRALAILQLEIENAEIEAERQAKVTKEPSHVISGESPKDTPAMYGLWVD